MRDPMIEKFLAALLLTVCLVMLLRLALGERLRRGFDAFWLHAWTEARTVVARAWHWRAARRRASRVAEEAIRRARAGVEREGNVVRPEAFRGPRKPH